MHATFVIIGDRGLLITGPSGSGKSSLALALLDDAHHNGVHGCLVSDDQCLPAAAGGRLVVSAPATIAGLIENWGIGIRAVEAQASAVVDLVVRLVPVEALERMPEPASAPISGIDVPSILLPERCASRALLMLRPMLTM